MSIKDCLNSAAAQGAISKAEADDLARQFDDHLAAARATMGDALAMAEAKTALEKALRDNAMEIERRAALTEAAQMRLKARFMAEADFYTAAKAVLSHFGFRNGSSVRGATEGILGALHGQLSDVMTTFRRKGVLGKRQNMAVMPDVVKALHGEVVANPVAVALGKSIGDVIEDLRLRFNAAGGNMPKLDGFGLPHSHDNAKVKAMGRIGWKDAIRPRLERSKIIDKYTGWPISKANLEKALDHAYDQIVSDSAAWLTPSNGPMGLGAISSRRQDSRFLVFKSGQDWLDYHQQFGKGDVVQAMFNHVNGMARDIAAMELLGPNPDAMVEWMRQVVQREMGQKRAGHGNKAGKVALMDGAQSEARAASAYLDWLWHSLRGNGTVVGGAASFTASVKNFTSSAVLGATGILAAATDPFIARAARKLAGLPFAKSMPGMIDMLKTQSRDEIVRSGVIWDEYLHVMSDELRFAGPALGADWTKWLADRTMMLNGLKPLTTGRKLVEARAWQAHIADLARAGTAFDALDPRFRRTLDGFGVTAEDWAIWSQGIDAAGFVTPMEIARQGGAVQYLAQATPEEAKALAHRRAAEKLAEITASWSERSVPTGTPNARAVVSAGQQRGTLPGELLDYFLQFKSFGLSFTALQMEALAEMGARGPNASLRQGAGYLASLVVPLSLGAAAYIQIKTLIDGKDPEEMDAAFWSKAVLTGGGFGLFGDFIKVTENRFGQSMIESLAGPGLAYLGDSFNLVWAMVLQPDARASEGRQYLQRWTPVASSHPATRLAWNRVVLDNLSWATDPKAHKAFKRQIGKAKKDGHPFWLPPGGLTPGARNLPARRAPNLGNAVGR